MKRGEVWRADLLEPTASEPGFWRPVVISQSDDFNRSRINTVVVAAITSNIKLAAPKLREAEDDERLVLAL